MTPLIIFPEGTRKMDDDLPLQPFKSGLFYLAKENPDCEFVPVWISNMNNVYQKALFYRSHYYVIFMLANH